MVGRRDLLKRSAGVIAAAGIGTGMTVQNADGQGITARESDDPKHIVLIVLDRSGSMTALRTSVITSVNEYLDQQANNTGMHIGLVQFDDNKTKDNFYCEPIFSFTPAATTPRLKANDYQPRGSTPLLAAFAESISKLEQVIRPQDRALLVVQTDGGENCSPPEITRAVIKQLISAKENEGNWTFAFMGADIDAWGEGGSLGIAAGSTLGYQNTSSGTQAAYATLSDSSNTWYTTTGGGITATLAASTPTNTNATFFINSNTGATIPANYNGKVDWNNLSTAQKNKWLKKNSTGSA